jgi:hypothetical protein
MVVALRLASSRPQCAASDDQLAALPGAQAQVLTQRRNAWKSAVAALRDASLVADNVRGSYSSSRDAEPAVTAVKSLLALLDQIAATLPHLEPPPAAIDLDGLSRLRGNRVRESVISPAVSLPQPETATSSEGTRRQPWWSAANF